MVSTPPKRSCSIYSIYFEISGAKKVDVFVKFAGDVEFSPFEVFISEATKKEYHILTSNFSFRSCFLEETTKME